MSGVYIKDMEMPVSFKDIRIYADGRIVSKSLHTYGEEIATAFPVHDHGNLIDADKMRESIRKQTAFLRLIGGEFAEIAETLEKGFLQEIDNAPIIIPADDSKLSATIKCGGAVTCTVASEEVYRGK